jgi:hypothetical protein
LNPVKKVIVSIKTKTVVGRKKEALNARLKDIMAYNTPRKSPSKNK